MFSRKFYDITQKVFFTEQLQTTTFVKWVIGQCFIFYHQFFMKCTLEIHCFPQSTEIQFQYVDFIDRGSNFCITYSHFSGAWMYRAHTEIQEIFSMSFLKKQLFFPRISVVKSILFFLSCAEKVHYFIIFLCLDCRIQVKVYSDECRW